MIATCSQYAGPPQCLDTDGGDYRLVAGTVYYLTSTYADTCTSATQLRENYCSAGARAYKTYACTCTSGRCTS